jgi:hypothetical protein
MGDPIVNLAMDHSEAVHWHRRLGHIGNTGWAQTIQNGQVEDVPVTTQSMSKRIKTPCESCVEEKTGSFSI